MEVSLYMEIGLCSSLQLAQELYIINSLSVVCRGCRVIFVIRRFRTKGLVLGISDERDESKRVSGLSSENCGTVGPLGGALAKHSVTHGCG